MGRPGEAWLLIEADRSALFLICSDQLNPSPKSKEGTGQLAELNNVEMKLRGLKTHLVL